MKLNKEQKLNLYYRALKNIEKQVNTSCGLCFLLYKVNKSDLVKVDIYEHLTMKTENGVFVKSKIDGFEEITNQVIGKTPCGDFWFPLGDWESRKLILLNAIKILEGGRTT